jgi:integrase
MPGLHAGRPPRNKGRRYPADPPTIEEIVAVIRQAGDGLHGRRLRGVIVVMWRAGLRIHEALALSEADLDPRRGSLLVRRGKGGRAAKRAWTTGAGSSSTSIYPQGIDSAEIIDTVHARRAPMIPVDASLQP